MVKIVFDAHSHGSESAPILYSLESAEHQRALAVAVRDAATTAPLLPPAGEWPCEYTGVPEQQPVVTAGGGARAALLQCIGRLDEPPLSVPNLTPTAPQENTSLSTTSLVEMDTSLAVRRLWVASWHRAIVDMSGECEYLIQVRSPTRLAPPAMHGPPYYNRAPPSRTYLRSSSGVTLHLGASLLDMGHGCLHCMALGSLNVMGAHMVLRYGRRSARVRRQLKEKRHGMGPSASTQISAGWTTRCVR